MSRVEEQLYAQAKLLELASAEIESLKADLGQQLLDAAKEIAELKKGNMARKSLESEGRKE